MSDRINTFFKKVNDTVQIDKILVNKIEYQNLINQNTNLTQRISSQEDDFNLQYQTFQAELQNLGKKICQLEKERETFISEISNLKHSVAAQRSRSRSNAASNIENDDQECENSDEANPQKGSEDQHEDDLTSIKNEFDREIQRLRTENAEKTRTISQLMTERMTTESTYCTKIERLNTRIAYQDDVIKKHNDDSDAYLTVCQRNKTLSADAEDFRAQIHNLNLEIESLHHLSEQRKTALDELAVEAQAKLQAKSEETKNIDQELVTTKQKLVIAQNEESTKEQALSLAQKQSWQKAREIDSLTQKVSTLDHTITGLEQQKSYLEETLQQAEKKHEKSTIQSKEVIEGVRVELEAKVGKLSRQLNESMEHNKRLGEELKSRDKLVSELSSRKAVAEPDKTTKVRSSPDTTAELKEAKQRAIAAERKVQILQRDMAKQLAIEKKNSQRLSQKIDQLVTKDGIAHSSYLKTHIPVTGSGSINSDVSRTSLHSTNDPRDPQYTELSKLRDENKRLRAELGCDRQRSNSQLSGANSNISGSGNVEIAVSRRSSNTNRTVRNNQDPTDQIDLKSLNQQLSSLLQDEMLKNQALRDNITDLSEQLAVAYENKN